MPLSAVPKKKGWPGSSKAHPLGEPYSDMNCNGVRDGPGTPQSGAGAAGAIVVYTVN